MTWFRAKFHRSCSVLHSLQDTFARLSVPRPMFAESFLIFGNFVSESWLDFARLFHHLRFMFYRYSRHIRATFHHLCSMSYRTQDISAWLPVSCSAIVQNFPIFENFILGHDLISRDFSFLVRWLFGTFLFLETFVPGHILISRDFRFLVQCLSKTFFVSGYFVSASVLISREISSFFVPHSITLQDNFARFLIILCSTFNHSSR